MAASEVRRWRLSVSALALLAVPVAPAAFAQTAKPAPVQLEEVVVSATRRNESLQRVPMSVLAVTESEIQKVGAQTLDDLAYRIPALSFRSTGPGRTRLALRGISSSAGVAPTVGFFIDESPLAASSSASATSFQQTNSDPNLFDIDRIEVLRGPQGTLYGSSSMGGALKIVTKQPNLTKDEAAVATELSTTAHGGQNGRVDAMANARIVPDKIALRLTATYIENSGFIDRLVGNFDAGGAIRGPGAGDVVLPSRTFSNTPVKRVEDVNSDRTLSVRATARIQATDDLQIIPMVFAQRVRQAGKSSFDNKPGDLDQRRPFDVSEPFSDSFVLSNLRAIYDLGFASLLSTTTYTQRSIRNVEDGTDLMSYYFGYSNDPNDLPSQRRLADGSLWNLNGPPFPATVQPIPAPLNEGVSVKDFTQEVRLTSNGNGPLRYVVGAYYKLARNRQGYNLIVPNYRETFPAYNTLLGSTFGNTFADSRVASRYNEVAGYGEATYDVLDALHVTFGARWFHYKTRFLRTTQGLFFGRPAPVGENTEAGASGFNPKVLVAYDYAPNAQVYVSATRGYRPGATNNLIPANRCDSDLTQLGIKSRPDSFAADSLWSYEAGNKSRLLDGRLTLNASAYYIEWENIQQRVTLPGCGVSYTDNVGAAHSRGTEVEMTAMVTPELLVSVGLGYNDATFSKDAPLAGVRAGDRLLDAPKWTINTTAEYTIANVLDGQAYIRASWSYVGASLDTLDQTSIRTGVVTPGQSKGAYSITDLRLGYSSDLWEAGLFVKNLFDKRVNLTSVDTLGQLYPTFQRISTNRPRTIGISLRRNF